MRQLFESSTAMLYRDIELALASGAPKTLERAMHSMKAADAQIGAMEMAARAGCFETAGREGRPSQPQWLAQLRHAHDRLRAAWPPASRLAA